ESLKAASGEFTRVSWARLFVFHPWFPVFDLGVNEYGSFGIQDSVVGLSPDPELKTKPEFTWQPVETLPTRHSKAVVPGALLILLYLALGALTVVGPYLGLEWLFQRDRALAERALLDTELAILDNQLESAENMLNSWNPGSISWYGGYENTIYDTRKRELATWVKIRRATASAEDVSGLYSGSPADLIKAEHLVRTGNASDAVTLYGGLMTYEGEHWRLFPSLMDSIRWLLKKGDVSSATALAHRCLAHLPEWKRQDPTTEEFRLFLNFCKENPPPAEAH
ncbi:MAG TPA: hypothetical protein PKO06_24690, partial [Candidatus Ozemobacteraceae bacterium]|nr:hypothetical protein [Candidatus Ozemobacteraceae bacterium]